MNTFHACTAAASTYRDSSKSCSIEFPVDIVDYLGFGIYYQPKGHRESIYFLAILDLNAALEIALESSLMGIMPRSEIIARLLITPAIQRDIT